MQCTVEKHFHSPEITQKEIFSGMLLLPRFFPFGFELILCSSIR